MLLAAMRFEYDPVTHAIYISFSKNLNGVDFLSVKRDLLQEESRKQEKSHTKVKIKMPLVQKFKKKTWIYKKKNYKPKLSQNTGFIFNCYKCGKDVRKVIVDF